MKLLLDIGNSAVKQAWLDGEQITGEQSWCYQKSHLGMQLDQVWKDMPVPDSVLVSNVAGSEVQSQLDEWVAAHWQCEVDYAQTQACHGELVNGYADPSTLGVDRWLAMIAALKLYPRPLVLVDCGTAVTIDVVDQTGQHQGGFILPGIASQLAAIKKNTDISLELNDFNVKFVPADCTKSAIISGIVYSIVSWIERVVADLDLQLDLQQDLQQQKTRFTRVITGGEAESVMAHFSADSNLWILNTKLVLFGLTLTNNKNK